MSLIIRDGANAGQLAHVDAQGNVSVMGSPAAITGTAAAWNSSTVSNSTISILTSGGYPAILLQLNQSSTFTGGAVTIEGTYDGTNWVTIPVAQILDPNTFATLTNPYTFQSATNRPILIIVGGYQQVRLRLSSVITGAGTVTPFWSLLSTNPFAGTSTIGGIVTVKNLDAVINGFVPDPLNAFETGTFSAPSLDANGQLITRGLALTDEGSFRDDFSGVTLTTALTGTLNFTNGQTNVTGSGTSFTTQVSRGAFIKQNTDPETLYTVVAAVLSDTQLTLATPYGGTTSIGASGVVSNWATRTGTGGSISVASSDVVIGSGTTTGQTTGIFSGESDYLPLIFEVGLSISQAIANQNIVFGIQDVFANAEAQVVVVLSGTNPALGMFVASFSSAITETTSVPFTFPGTDSTNAHKYRISLVGNAAYLSIDETIVATISDHIPGPYTVVTPVVYIQNTGVPSSTTSISADYAYFSDVDRLEISNQFDKPLVVQSTDSSAGAPNTSIQPITAGQIAGWDGTHLRVVSTDASGQIKVLVQNTPAVTVSGTVGVTQSTSPWVVSLASTTITGTVAVTQSTSPWVVSGTVTANAGTGNFTVVQGTASNLNATVVGTGTFAVQAAQSGTWTVQQGGAPWSQNITQVGGSAVTLGQKTSANSFPVVIASDQSTINTQDAADGTPGSAASAVTMQVGGSDGTDLRTLLTSNTGQLHVIADSGSTTVVTGTVAVTQSTSPWVVSGTVTANAGTGNFATNLTQIAGSGVATAAAGIQKVGVTDSNGNGITSTSNALDVNIKSSGATVSQNLTEVGGAAISLGQTTMADSVPVVIASDQTAVPISGTVAISGSVVVTQGTSPWVVSGTVTANIGTTGGITVAQGSTTSGQSGPLVQGAVTTAAPTYTTAQTSPLSLDTAGNLRTSVNNTVTVSGTVAATQSGTWNIGTVTTVSTITNPVTVSQGTAANLNATVVGTGTFAVQVTGTVAVTQSTSPWTVQGDSASGAANAGNPVKTGGVFNTTQPTVTNGQTVDSQSTARGANIVATGVDTFNVTVNAPLPAGTNVIGHVITDSGSTTVVTGTVAVTQSTSPWVVSLTSTTITGTVAVTQSTSPWTIQGDSASGAANAGNPVKGGGVFNTTQPTVTNGQTVDQQSTARGGLIVAVGVDGFAITGTVTANQGGAPWSQNLTQVAGTSLGATAVTNFGSAPAAAAVPGVNASIFAGTTGITATGSSLNTNVTNTVTVTGTVAATQSGNWTTRIVGNAGATLDGTVAAGAAPTNGLAILGQFNTTIPAPTAAQTVSLQTDSTGALAINTEGRKTTYRVGIVAFTPIASATAPTVSITGSATKTVRITRIVFSASAATGTISDLQLLRFSALTGGTPNSQAANVAKMDTNNAVQTAVVNQWSAAATTATSAGILNAKRFEVVTAAVSVQPGEIEWKFGDDNGQGLVLRGTGDFAGIRISAVGTTPLADCWVEWTEE